MLSEFTRLYEAYSQGRLNPLQPLAIQYADYVQWQRKWLVGKVLERQLAYWETQLAALSQAHTLLLDRSRPAVQTFNGATRVQIYSSDMGQVFPERLTHTRACRSNIWWSG